jgi:ribosomal protein L19
MKVFAQNQPRRNSQHSRFPKPQVGIRAKLIADESCSALGITVRGPAPVLALCRRLVEVGHDPATAIEAWRGDVLCLQIRSIGQAAQLRLATHGIGFERLCGCTGASPVRQNRVACAGHAVNPLPFEIESDTASNSTLSKSARKPAKEMRPRKPEQRNRSL